MMLTSDTRLGPYEVRSLLGSGSMGEVYRARDPRLDREVAIKIISVPDKSGGAHRRFLHEARAVSALNHPSIVTIYDVGEEEGISYIVTELVDGVPLRQVIKQHGALPLRKVLDIGIQIADGLAAAHEMGMIHRDLKPENIMVTRDGRVKILDFGLAKSIDEELSDLDATLSGNETAPGLVLGTAAYMSPEQARGGRLSFWSDQFALGVILYEMTTGQSPYRRETGLQTLSAILSEDPPILTRGSVAFQWLVRRCLHKQPDHRYASTKDLLNELRNIRTQMTDTLPQEAIEEAAPAEPEPEPEPKALPVEVTRRPWADRILLGLAILCAAAAGYLLSNLRERSAPATFGGVYRPFAASTGLELSPAWSPNGKTIAYVADKDGVLQVFTRSSGAQPATQLTRSPQHCFAPFWSPDGTRLYYVSDSDGQPGLWSVGATGGTPQKLFDNVLRASVAPDGLTLAAIRQDTGSETYSVWMGSLQQQKLARYDRAPFGARTFLRSSDLQFSPDGKWLAVRIALPTTRSELWLLPMQSGEPRKALPDFDAAAVSPEFTWMPDSRRIVYAGRSGSSIRPHLFEADLATGTITPLTTGSGSELAPSVSPSGRSVAYAAASFDYDLVTVPLAGGAFRDVLSTALDETAPALSPGGNFAFVTNRSGEPEIWLKSPREGWDRPIVSGSVFGEESTRSLSGIEFSPDGNRIAYVRADSDHAAIWISSITGNTPVRLAKESGDAAQAGPTWSPDGNSIAYFSMRNGRYVLMVARVGGIEPPVVLAESAGRYPKWSPAGDWIALLQSASGLTLIKPDGSSRRNIGSGLWLLHGWSRDGKTIVGIKKTEAGRLAVAEIRVRDREEAAVGDLGPVPPEFSYSLFRGDLPLQGCSVLPDRSGILTSVLRAKSDIWLLEQTR